jgi:hypothetical protein
VEKSAGTAGEEFLGKPVKNAWGRGLLLCKIQIHCVYC